MRSVIFFSIFICSCNRNHYDIIYIMIGIFVETTATIPRYGRTLRLFLEQHVKKCKIKYDLYPQFTA